MPGIHFSDHFQGISQKFTEVGYIVIDIIPKGPLSLELILATAFYTMS